MFLAAGSFIPAVISSRLDAHRFCSLKLEEGVKLSRMNTAYLTLETLKIPGAVAYICVR